MSCGHATLTEVRSNPLLRLLITHYCALSRPATLTLLITHYLLIPQSPKCNQTASLSLQNLKRYELNPPQPKWTVKILSREYSQTTWLGNS